MSYLNNIETLSTRKALIDNSIHNSSLRSFFIDFATHFGMLDVNKLFK